PPPCAHLRRAAAARCSQSSPGCPAPAATRRPPARRRDRPRLRPPIPEFYVTPVPSLPRRVVTIDSGHGSRIRRDEIDGGQSGGAFSQRDDSAHCEVFLLFYFARR